MASPSPPTGVRRKRSEKIHQRDDLELFNMLEHPVWVFDIEQKAMWWANESALELWNAESLADLTKRNFADDMSAASERRLADYLAQFQQGKKIHSQWTYYPTGRGATTVKLALSGITIQDDDGSPPRLAMLNEGVVPPVDTIDQESLRGVEMLRHLPVAVGQFDTEGHIMSQNPQDLHLFGSPSSPVPRESECAEEPAESDNSDTRLAHFLGRFVDTKLGRHALETVREKEDYCFEAQQRTRRGIRWFSICLRLSKDPVTSQPVVLYSARDTTEIQEARQDADQAKAEFLAVMAHEIRTPLHQVVGFLDLLLQTTLSESQSEYVRLMESSGQTLMSVINDLLDYTKIEAGKLQLESLPFEVKGVMEGCKSVIEPKTLRKGLTMNCKIPLNLPIQLIGDPNRLRQILLNLLQNAVKFTHQGSISLSVTSVVHESRETHEDHYNTDAATKKRVRVRFQVEDTGIGISPEQQKHVFEKYRQANASIARDYGGTGLGLAICKSLVEAMDGSIHLESSLGKGTAIAFELPFDVPAKQERASLVAANTSNAMAEASSSAEFPAPSTTTSTSHEDSPAQKLRILVVEDNKMNQKVVTAMLKRLGHTVSVADNGALGVEAVEEALARAQDQHGSTCNPSAPNQDDHHHHSDDCGCPYDLVFMDVQMPVLDGIVATKVLRNKGIDEEKLPIVGLTASFQPANWQYYRDCGMNDCTGKPVRMPTLKKVIEKWALHKDDVNETKENSAVDNGQLEPQIPTSAASFQEVPGRSLKNTSEGIDASITSNTSSECSSNLCSETWHHPHCSMVRVLANTAA